jgi:hypothetical protein
VYFTQLGTLVAPLTSRASIPVVINVCFDQPLVCGIKLHYEDVCIIFFASTTFFIKESIVQVEVLKLRQLSDNIIFLKQKTNNKMHEGVWVKIE